MFGISGVGVLAAGELGGELHLLVGTTRQVEGCGPAVWSLWPADAGKLVARRTVRAPAGGGDVAQADLPVRRAGLSGHDVLRGPPVGRASGRLTRRAITWAVDALEADDTTVSALARRLGVGWHTLWRAVKVEAAARVARPGRLDGVETLGVEARVASRSLRAGRDVTVMVDLTRGADGVRRARLLDMAPGRSGTVYKRWLDAQAPAFRAGVKHAALDPVRGYANARRDGLGDAVAVLDAFHVVKLGTQVMDEVRRRVQQDTLRRRGRRDDPLYKIRGLLRHGAENLSERQIARLDAALDAGDPDYEVTVTWQCYQQLDSDTATATLPTTGSECSWPRTANAPTAEPAPQSHDHPQRRRAGLSTYDVPWRFSAWTHLGADLLVPQLVARE